MFSNGIPGKTDYAIIEDFTLYNIRVLYIYHTIIQLYF